MAKTAFRGICLILALATAGPGAAHELWLEAEDWTVEIGDTVAADIRNGVDLAGAAYPWYDPRVAGASLVTTAGTTPFQGRPGDLPAIQFEATEPGLNVVVYEANMSQLTYDAFDKFREFTTEKGLDAALQEHLSEGLPQEHLREGYTRHVKALIAVDGGAGEDGITGMAHEFVAETNPYTLPAGQQMQVRLYRQDAPVPGVRVTVFRRDPDGTVEHILRQTDAEGRVRFPLEPASLYLVDNVDLRRTTRSELVETAAFWISSWAALTFGTD